MVVTRVVDLVVETVDKMVGMMAEMKADKWGVLTVESTAELMAVMKVVYSAVSRVLKRV